MSAHEDWCMPGQCECLAEAVAALHDRIDAALDLHLPHVGGKGSASCEECSDPESSMTVPWPCATAQALGVTGDDQ